MLLIQEQKEETGKKSVGEAGQRPDHAGVLRSH